MNTSGKNAQSDKDEKLSSRSKSSSTEDAVEEDGTPVLDERDLEENNLTVEEADNIEWDEPEKGGKSK